MGGGCWRLESVECSSGCCTDWHSAFGWLTGAAADDELLCALIILTFTNQLVCFPNTSHTQTCPKCCLIQTLMAISGVGTQLQLMTWATCWQAQTFKVTSAHGTSLRSETWVICCQTLTSMVTSAHGIRQMFTMHNMWVCLHCVQMHCCVDAFIQWLTYSKQPLSSVSHQLFSNSQFNNANGISNWNVAGITYASGVSGCVQMHIAVLAWLSDLLLSCD